MSRIPEYIVDEILQTARIEEVIGDYVQLKRAGSNFKGLSPFTEERTPSFFVSPGKQIFKCFSTGKGGNAASFLMEIEHFSYPEALKWLAKKYGIDVPEDKPPTPEELAATNERDSLFIVNEFAQKHFSERLLNHEQGKAIGLSYFIERGFREDIITKFQLGYCLEIGTDLTQSALAAGYKLDYLEKSGLSKTNERGSFDFFRGRVMFPIHSISGRILGFGGRTLKSDKNIAKYFNSPESIIYNKSQILYGMHFAKNAIIKFDNCYLVEGYTDVISMHQAGIENVVASSGTSLTEDQIHLIKRYTNNITILYDGDSAGIKASFRGIDLILAQGLNVKVVLFPDGDDPDSYSKKVSRQELEEYIQDNARDFIAFKSNILLEDSGNDPIKRAELIKGILNSIAVIPDAISRTLFLKECALLFGVEEHILTGELNKLRIDIVRKEQGIPIVQERNKTTADQSLETEKILEKANLLEAAEREVLEKMLRYGAYILDVEHLDEENNLRTIETSVIELIIHELQKDDIEIQSPVLIRIYNKFLQGIAENKLYTTKSFLKDDDQRVVSFVASTEMEEYALSENWFNRYRVEVKKEDQKLYKAVMNAVLQLKRTFVGHEVSRIDERLKTLKDEENVELISMLLSEKTNYNRVIKAIDTALGRI
jgi:DNA primase